ncbi:TPA: hypothetical protein DDX46_00445 [Candidatus Saccharibacteria bacterium]|nr:MAG: hypothetical protein UW38_C0001G0722 [Candidatus Saccharibacteria bacterium GW2011_GWC2_44_17]OGL33663.1 MAG: hypothetical protein A3E20_02830 [Candidatus Saccharibacteria bacterium RIFCSPHIGHO2_12_FULL_47_16]HBH77203.1 hypothetical protein [Candidatus Saccharibacteria bacterium]
MKIKKQSNKIYILVLISLILIVAVCIVVFYFTKSRSEETEGKSNQNQSEKSLENRTYTTESEGATNTVPDNVDPSSIKNYKLLTENETYKIRELSGKYYVTLYPIINRPDQSNTYVDQLKEYKQSAINYLEKNNIDTKNTKIYYEPSEATDL